MMRMCVRVFVCVDDDDDDDACCTFVDIMFYVNALRWSCQMGLYMKTVRRPQTVLYMVYTFLRPLPMLVFGRTELNRLNLRQRYECLQIIQLMMGSPCTQEASLASRI